MSTFNGKRQCVVAKQGHIGLHPRLGAAQTVPVNLLLEFGNIDMSTNPWFDSDNMMIVLNGQNINPRVQDYFWNSETEKFQTTAP